VKPIGLGEIGVGRQRQIEKGRHQIARQRREGNE